MDSQKPLKTPEPLMTSGEVAGLFRVDPKTVGRWAAAGKLGSVRTLGGHRRYRRDEVLALLTPPEGANGETPSDDLLG